MLEKRLLEQGVKRARMPYAIRFPNAFRAIAADSLVRANVHYYTVYTEIEAINHRYETYMEIEIRGFRQTHIILNPEGGLDHIYL